MNTFDIILIIIVVLVLTIAQYVYLMKRCHFICPECNHKFKPTYRQLIFSLNALAGKVLRCPNCKSSVYMEPEKANDKLG